MLKGILSTTSLLQRNFSCIRRVSHSIDAKSLMLNPLAADIVKIKNQSPLAEFKRYIEGFKIEGEGFTPCSENSSSTFMEYFLHRKKVCVPKPAKKLAGMSIPAKPAPPKIVRAKDDESCILSLIDFKNFMQRESRLATKEEYYQVVDEIARLMPNYVRKVHPNLRPEIIEKSGDIFRWRALMDVEAKGLTRLKFYDEDAKMQAIREYTQFVEDLTGKKVLIGSPTRMTIATDELGILNDPASYKDVDYILFGHGTGSSLDGTWKFSDNGKSVWEFIEENVPKGKRVLVGCCEEDGLTVAARKALPGMYDKSGNYMFGIGQPVSTCFNRDNPAKICESGIRHIIGHSLIAENHKSIDSFIDSYFGTVKNVYYNL